MPGKREGQRESAAPPAARRLTDGKLRPAARPESLLETLFW
jgi:hypothetical protein